MIPEKESDTMSTMRDYLDLFHSREAIYEARGLDLAEKFNERYDETSFTDLEYVLSTLDSEYLDADWCTSVSLLDFAIELLASEQALKLFRSMDPDHQIEFYNRMLISDMGSVESSLMIYVMTDGPPYANPIFNDKNQVDSKLKSMGYSKTNGSVIRRIARFAIEQNNHNEWSVCVWYLSFKYGYELIEEIIDRIETEGVKVDHILTFAKIVQRYESVKEYPMTWIMNVS